MSDSDSNIVVIDAVIVAVTNDAPRVLTVRGGLSAASSADENLPALPSGPFRPELHRTLELAVRDLVEAQTGRTLGYVEQLYTFGDRYRDPRELRGGPRVVSVGYLALVREDAKLPIAEAEWGDLYGFLPWEDWRDGRPAPVNDALLPALREWAAQDDAQRSGARAERLSIAFGSGRSNWDFERVLDRYELLYEAGLVAEAVRDARLRRAGPAAAMQDPMAELTRLRALRATGAAAALDHRRMMATALGRLRGKLGYRPVVFELVPKAFTLSQLQHVVESLGGLRLHKQNFRRLLVNNKLVEETGARERSTGGRPAALFRFRRSVVLERPQPGIGLPTASPAP